YGKVKGYSPREAITYTPFTTLDGIFEKDTGRDPFDAPDKLRELWRTKNYGNHAVNGTIPLDFLTTNDIIGGNSGSPVLNGKGEQVGIAFDGNYEGLGNDFFFNPSLGRTIVVDIRYVLFLTDKFGDAGWILKEMDIKGGNRKAMTAGMQ
ncbi:MAG: S46 family peptidase, partial [Aridibacter sp.]